MMEWKPLGSIADFEYGYTAGAITKGTHRFIRITDINADGTLKPEPCMYVNYPNQTDEMNLHCGDILVARTGGTYGKTAVFSEEYPAVFASFLIRIRFNVEIDPIFYWQFAQSDMYWEQAKRLVKGGTQPQFNANALKKIRVPITDIKQQKIIVARLKSQLAAIDVLEEKGKSQIKNISALITRINKDTIDFSGNIEPISKFCAEDKVIVQPNTDEAKKLQYLGMENIDKDTWQHIPSVDIVKSGSSTTYYFDGRHVLYGKLRPYLKKAFLPSKEGRCSTELVPLLPSAGMNREYLALLLTADNLTEYIMRESTGARMPRTDIKKLLAYQVAVPDIKEQTRRLQVRAQAIAQCATLIAKLRKQQDNVTALRACVFREAFGSEE